MLILLCAAVAPALILMWFVYHRDFNPEPVNLIAKGFLYGAIATFASTLISQPLAALGAYTQEPHSIAEAIKISFFGAGIPEETAKLVMLWLLLRNCREFDERYDGIVYAVSVGLGFATLENIMYVVSAGADWFSVSISRAMFAVPGHFSFAVIMGYYYSKYHFMGPEKSAPRNLRLDRVHKQPERWTLRHLLADTHRLLLRPLQQGSRKGALILCRRRLLEHDNAEFGARRRRPRRAIG